MHGIGPAQRRGGRQAIAPGDEVRPARGPIAGKTDDHGGAIELEIGRIDVLKNKIVYQDA
jgi:hypothetical protein